ncbi:MAG TPA: glycosyltransferase [Solirubrobacterales bacterium]|nr:glycosyltransferase [Solirubrobacterales bacterium]
MTAPEVSVYIQTYQHCGYIAGALDSVLSQRTPFATEIVVADDCSTDGTRELLAAYRDRHPDLIRLVLPERNVGPTEIFRRGVADLRGRYVAWLDGDDYWSDPEKLVRQVEAMDAHPGWSACFHDATVRQVDGDAPDRPYVAADVRGPLSFADLLRSNPIPSLSVMARGDHVRNLPGWVWEGLWADWLAVLAFARQGPIGYLPEAMGAYRVHRRGLSSGLSRTEQLQEDLRLFGLLRRSLGGEHRAGIEAAIRSRRAQLAVERDGVPFSGAVALLALGEEAPAYLNGREVWGLTTATAVGELDRLDRDGGLALRLEQMRQAAAAAAPSRAHFPGDDHVPAGTKEGRLFLLVVGPLVDWLERYSRLGRQLEGSARLVSRDDACALYEVVSKAGAPAPMGALIDISEVTLAGQEGLLGCHIDRPKPGTVSDAHAIEVGGWALGDGNPAVAVELSSGGRVFRRVPLGLSRPDLAEAFPQSPEAGSAGFQETVSLVGTAPEVEIEVSAVLKDQQRVPVGSIRGARRWRETLSAPAPLVSVIVPCYGQAPYLEEAIESVLAQTYTQVEVVVVDDGSPDNAARIAARFPGVRCVRQPNQGLANARNTGIRESEGELLVFLDADDRLLPRALEAGVAELRAHPEAAFAFGRYRRIAADGTRLGDDEQPRPETDPYVVFLRYNYAGIPADGIYRRSALEAAENFDEGLPGAEDYDLGLRLSREFAVRPHEEFVAEYRVHAEGMSQNAAAMLTMTRRVLRRQRRAARQRGLRQEYREGHRFWRRYYGDPLAARIRSAFANREFRRGFRLTRSLLRTDPRGLVSLRRR